MSGARTKTVCLGPPYWQFEVFDPVGVDTEYDYVFEGAQVFTNGSTTFLSLSDNSLIPWGSNGVGQYGIGKTGAPSMSLEKFAVDVSSVDDQVIVSADGGGGGGDGGSFGIFCSQDGTVWGWGVNDSGHPGKGDNTGTSTPTPVTSPGSDCGFFDCGEKHVIAVYGSTHSVYSWGNNGNGQLGLEDNVDRNTPVEVTVIDPEVLDVACGSWHSVVLDENGNAWSWGDKGAIGYDYEQTIDTTKPIALLENIRLVASNGGSPVAYTHDGILYYLNIDSIFMGYEESEYLSDIAGNELNFRESDIWSADRNLQGIEGGGGHFFFIEMNASLFAF